MIEKKKIGRIGAMFLFAALGAVALGQAVNPGNPPGSVMLAWNASAGTNVITNYWIYWGPASAFYTNRFGVGTNLTGTVSNLLRGPVYYFAATAQDNAGLESDYSNEVFTNCPVPPPPPTQTQIKMVK